MREFRKYLNCNYRKSRSYCKFAKGVFLRTTSNNYLNKKIDKEMEITTIIIYVFI